MANTYRRLAAVAKGQLGLLSRQQARGVGMSDAQLRNRVQSGSLIQTGRNTFRLPGVPPAALTDLRALLLDIGGEVDAFSGARTLIDLARSSSPEALTRALDSGLRAGKFSEDHLHRRIVALRSKGRHGIPQLLDVIDGMEVTRGGHSWLEREYLRLLSRAGLPRPSTQQVLSRAGDRVVRVDFRSDGTPVVVEVLGYRFHRTNEQMRRDVERMNALLADGLLPFQFTYEQVVRAPAEVVATTASALGVARSA